MTGFDVIVVGAGHAGVEAAWAARRLGCHVGLCTLSTDTVAHMPCNPAIGGTAKGHLVREIDALGGLMGRAIDGTGIQFKLLNRSRGPAVWSPRAQADKVLYGQWVKNQLERTEGIEWIIGRAGRLLTDSSGVRGLALEDGRQLWCRSLVITTGTFLNGRIHIGPEQRPAGRVGEPPSRDLAESIRASGFGIGRLKTGTPPRLDAASIDFNEAEARGVFHVEHGDPEPVGFSFSSDHSLSNKIPCWLLHTRPEVHDLVRRNIGLSPLFNGQIRGIGPRYCPSLEDKVMRFPDRERHQLYLEPEGIQSQSIYLNGYSMSLPVETQVRLVRALEGLEEAELLRPGYAIEYDFVQPTELACSLEAHRLPRLFLAGQINGTSGYEEAAGQGLIAGLNAGRTARGLQTVTLGRDEAYIGIMVDDLVTKGCLEPYRMFTSRAEYRLMLRIDNADLRLTPIGRQCGLVDDRVWERFQERRDRYVRNLDRVRSTTLRLPGREPVPVARALRQSGTRLAELADRGDVKLETTPRTRELDLTSVETEVKFEGYLRRQLRAVERARKQEERRIPEGFAYRNVPGLSTEVIERFEDIRPATLGQALRIPGVTPAAVAVLGAFVGRLEDGHA